MPAPRRSQPTLIRELLSSVMQARGLGRRLEHRAVFEAWERVVPEAFAKRARPVSFRASKLIVAVSSAPLLEELRCFRASEFLRLLNHELTGGEGPHCLVQKVEFRRA
ncbi:MAG: DUF721 domain-containing protein [Planctomycetes bacterium]|nr:DUF721 domain-containing protein [Planctomycetota bacterium]